jgi:uncharacterized spore protein YtfJ
MMMAIRTIEGRPVQVGDRELVPVVRVETDLRRRAFVGASGLAGEGAGFVHMRPVAILERSEKGERRIPIHDRTAQLLGGLLLAALVISALMLLAERIARKN